MARKSSDKSAIPLSLIKIGVIPAKGGEKYIPKIEMISTGMKKFDDILGGGFPRGRMVEVYGPEGGGKTTLAAEIAASILQFLPKSFVVFIDAEHALNMEYLEEIGVDLSRFGLNQPMSAEEGFKVARKAVEQKASAVIIDSIAAMVPQDNLDKDPGNKTPAVRARLVGTELNIINSQLNTSGTIFICLNQVREKIGVRFGNPETTPGGKALKFYASIRIRVAKGTSIKAKSDDSKEARLGHWVKVNTDKNKCAMPFRSCELPLIYGKGIHGARGIDRRDIN